MDDVAVLENVEEPGRVFDVAVWRRFGLCAGREPGLFVGPQDEGPAVRHLRESEALRLCAGCPVRLPCREFARRGREFGVWGGETEAERARLGCGPPDATARETQREAIGFRRRQEVGL